MKNTGILRIQAFGARQSSPIEGVLVTVSGNGFTAQRITDETGTAADLSIEAPSCALSLQEDNTIRPYAVVDLTAAKTGFRTVRIQGVQIFAGQVTLAQPEMIPKTEEDRDVVNPPIVIPEHSLFTGDGGSGPDPMENCMPRVLSRVIIPKNITVHLGKPAASARNVTVSFRDYIANVASSEVYPTWPEQALRANIHCQISLALNRIYTEWYPSKGYPFNITNSTSYDQYYVHGRTVFDVMVRITDDIFNTYLRKTGTVNPYYSEYCDGKSVTCPGLKQWGTVTLANQGRNALQILKYYYGNDIEIIRTSNIQSIPQSYPGSPIRQGDSGTAVFTLQRQLNRITKDYPFLGLLTVDGIFGRKMTETVKKFQKQFNLTYVFISHDLGIIKYISDRIMIMYLGRVMEFYTSEGIYADPKHPYTQALLSAIPPESPFEKKERLPLTGDIPSPIGDQVGCPLAGRCPHCTERCKKEIPKLVDTGDGHMVACFLYE